MAQHRWSKLQIALYRIIDPKTSFQIHCCAYNIGECIPFPRYWITIGKTIIWDFPKDFMDDDGAWYVYDETKKLSCLIREYINCPPGELTTRRFENDPWGIVPILRACDRRVGKCRLRSLLENTDNEMLCQIIRNRLQ